MDLNCTIDRIQNSKIGILRTACLPVYSVPKAALHVVPGIDNKFTMSIFLPLKSLLSSPSLLRGGFFKEY